MFDYRIFAFNENLIIIHKENEKQNKQTHIRMS